MKTFSPVLIPVCFQERSDVVCVLRLVEICDICWVGMAGEGGAEWVGLRSAAMAALSFLLASALVSTERTLMRDASPRSESEETVSDYLLIVVNFLWQPDKSSCEHVWPPMEFGWKIIVGSLIGFFGAAFGSVGVVGGGGIFVPMFSLITGFDPKSATAISKCMIMGAAVSTVYYNLKLRHPTLDMPIIDYGLALLFQPMLMLGISILE